MEMVEARLRDLGGLLESTGPAGDKLRSIPGVNGSVTMLRGLPSDPHTGAGADLGARVAQNDGLNSVEGNAGGATTTGTLCSSS